MPTHTITAYDPIDQTNKVLTVHSYDIDEAIIQATQMIVYWPLDIQKTQYWQNIHDALSTLRSNLS